MFLSDIRVKPDTLARARRELLHFVVIALVPLMVAVEVSQLSRGRPPTLRRTPQKRNGHGSPAVSFETLCPWTHVASNMRDDATQVVLLSLQDQLARVGDRGTALKALVRLQVVDKAHEREVENRRQLAKTSGADRGLEAVALTAHPLVIAVKRFGLQLRFE